jgi:hypothetical protein
MIWSRRKSSWPIDPLNVQLGSVVESRGQNLSRTHVRVKYHRESHAQFVPLETFAKRCQEALRDEKPLGIDHLRVAPILKQRQAAFFDRLTDWQPAVQMVRQERIGPQRREQEREN